MSSIQKFSTFFKKAFRLFGFEIIRLWSPHRYNAFFSHYYQRNTRRRLEHLASLPLAIAGASVFEVGAGLGDHTDFFIDRGCTVVTSDARTQCVKVLKTRYPKNSVIKFDLESNYSDFSGTFDIVYCAGVLYHVSNPEQAIARLAKVTAGTLIVSTIVSYDKAYSIKLIQENPGYELHSISGGASRPSRLWVFEQLKRHFPFVYMPVTQPNHAEFPVNWNCPGRELLPKAVFIASRTPIVSNTLVEEIPMIQTYQQGQ